MGLVWHYSNGLAIPKILEEGVIRLATAGIKPPERGVAWFSTNPIWEPSANRGNMLIKKQEYQPGLISVATKDIKVTKFDPDEMDKAFHGRFRIGIAPEHAPHDWKALKKLARIPKEIALSMETNDHAEWGNPAEWRGTLVPVTRSMWRTVEKLERGIWVKYVDLGFTVEGGSPEGGRWGRN